jgi:HEAT repeats
MVMPTKLTCSEFEDFAVLQALGELDDIGSAAVAEHASVCANCAAVLLRETRLHSALAAHDEAGESLDRSGFLLARCRSELSETLDDAQAAGERSWLAWLSPAHWAETFRQVLAFHPGWSTAALLIAGALGGIAGRAWYRETTFPLPGKPLMTVSAAPRVSDRQLETMDAQDIRLEPQEGAALRVELRLRSEQPMVLQGTPDDAEIRRVLSYVVGHGQRFGPALRLDSLDVLRTHTSDPQVRSALCDAALRDSNPAVRLKALEALRSFGVDPAARQAMFEALAADNNSGVRIEAVDELQAALAALQTAPPNNRAVAILRDRMHNDPNRYIRLRSASVLSQLTSLEDTR